MCGLEGKAGIVVRGGRCIGTATARRLPHRHGGKPDDGEWVNGQLWHVHGGPLLRD